MSVTNKVIQLLSLKYGFDIKEATEYVKVQQAALKNLTKEEKDAIKAAEKQANVAAKAAEKQAKVAAKAAEKQAKVDAKVDAKEVKKEVKKPENNRYFVTFHDNTKQLDEEDIHFLGDHDVEFIETVEQISNTDIVPLCASNLSDYAKFVKKHADDIDDTELGSVWYCYKQYEKPIQNSYTFVFHGEEYQVKFHQI